LGDDTRDDLHDGANAPDETWDEENDQLSRQREVELRAFDEEPDDPSRRSRRVAAAGDRTGQKTAAGDWSIAAEQIHAYFTTARPSLARAGCLPADVVTASTDTYVPTDDHKPLLDTLLRHNVAYLSGPDGAGRLTSAQTVLADLSGRDKVVLIDLNEDARLADVLDHKDILRDGHGHMLELAAGQPPPRRQTLGALVERLAKCHSYLIIVGPHGPADNSLDMYEVSHQAPAIADVLTNHLTCMLRDREHWSDERIRDFLLDCRTDPAIQEQLRRSWRPRDAVLLARQLVDVGARGGKPGTVVELMPTALRSLATSVLRDADEDGDTNTLRRLTARIVYAIYHGHPTSLVSELASRLLDMLPPEQPAEPSPVARTVFDGSIDNLVAPEMRAATTNEVNEPDHLAQLVDPALARAVLDVVWHEYDLLRDPLLAWLRDLGGDHRERVRLRAGQMAGQLAIYDFGQVYRELLRPWAASPRKLCRQAASWAMERAVLEPHLTGRVCRQVQDWVYSRDPFLNDSAARCYATRIGTEFTLTALVHLYLVALRREQVRNAAVAQAVVQLYEPDRPESGTAILEELTHWAEGERCLQVHAARSLTFLAHRMAPPPDERWPALLLAARDDATCHTALTGLWQTALTEPMIATRGWDVLLSWILRADGHDDLEEVTTQFAAAVLNAPPLRARAPFYLAQWRSAHAEIAIVRRLQENLRKGDE
jgi:hypothetical protein